MLLYRQLKKQNVFDHRDYRLFVKRRLYIRNKVSSLSIYEKNSAHLFSIPQEALETVDEQERIDKLHATYEGLEEDYRRILASLRV